jgi:hypothetical protein
MLSRAGGERVSALRTLSWLTLYGVSMACLEAVVVVYLRQHYYPDDLLAIFPPRALSEIALAIEIVREAATMLMILSVAALAQRDPRRIFAAFAYVFGVWDVFYYVWLKVFLGWPVSWTEWDILFLIPWAWLGPWLTPVLIALLFVAWGGWVLLFGARLRFTAANLALFVSGTSLCLAAFLQPAFLLLPRGIDALAGFVPGRFWWHLFIPGYILMAVGLADVIRQRPQAPGRRFPPRPP